MPTTTDTIEHRVLGFTHLLRQQGFNLGIDESHDLIKVLSSTQHPDQHYSRNMFKSICCNNRDQWQVFDQLFQQYWFAKEFIASRKNMINPEQPLQNNNGSVTGLSGGSEKRARENEFNTTGTGAGKQTTLSKANFRFITDRQAMRKAENLAEKLARINSIRLCRQYRSQSYGRHLDFRKTIRSNLQNGISLNKLHFKQRQKKPPQLIILHDISHSMSWNNPLLFRFSRGLIKHFKDSHAFVFHTELYPVTRLYRLDSLQQIREQLESNNHLWLGGTSIASSIQKYLDTFAQIQKQNSTVIIMSDGFDTDSTDQLAETLSQLKQRSRYIIWLSPMLDNPDYSAAPEFTQATSQYLDDFLPCSSLESLNAAIQRILHLNKA